MAKLPNKDSLSGPASLRSGRMISSAGLSGAFQGLRSLGGSLTGVGREFAAEEDKTRNQDTAVGIARAEAVKTEQFLATQNEFDQDGDFSTFQTRAAQKTKEIVDKAAALIPDPQKRQLWLEGARGDAARVNDGIADKANGLRRQATVNGLDEALEAYRRVYVDPATSEEEKKKARADIEGAITVAGEIGILTPDQQAARKDAFIDKADVSRAELEVRTNPGAFIDHPSDPIENVADAIIGNESSGDPSAQNSRSSAGGLGGFIDSTWVATAKKFRPDVTRGMSNDQIIELKKSDAKLARELTIRHTQDNANGLASAGLPVTDGNVYLAHFAGLSGAKNILSAPDDTAISSILSADAIKANPEVLGGGKTVGEVKAWADRKMGNATDAVPNVQFIDATAGKIRDKPVQTWVKDGLARAAAATDPRIAIKIVSGGQDDKQRTGSKRHDHGNAADLILVVDGKEVKPSENKALYAAFFRNAAANGFKGLGHYEWGIHVGGGAQAAWGPDKSTRTLDPEFAQAAAEGWGNPVKSGGRGKPAYWTNISPEDRARLSDQAATLQTRADTQMAAQQKAEYESYKDSFGLSILQGNILSEQDIIRDPVLNDGDKSTLLRSFRTEMEGALSTAAAVQSFASGDLRVDPYDIEGKKAVDGVYDAVTKASPGSLQTTTEELVRQTGIVPKQAMSLLRQGLTSTDVNAVMQAAQVASRLSAINPAAITRREGGAEVQKMADDFGFYVNNLNLPPEEAARRLQEMQDPAKMRDRKALEPAAKEFVKSLSSVDIASEFDDSVLGLGSNPELGFTPAQSIGLQAEFMAIAESEFFRKNGNPDLAKNSALQEMKRLYGPTELTGKSVVMRHPPERYWPAFKVGLYGETHDYAKIQLKHDLGQLYPNVDMDRVQLVSTPETDAMVKRGEMPGYSVLYTDDNGVMQTIPGMLWRPDVSEQSRFKAEREAAEAAAAEEAARAARPALEENARQMLKGRDRDQTLDNFLDADPLTGGN